MPPLKRQESTEEEEDIDSKEVEHEHDLEGTDLDHIPTLAFYDHLEKYVATSLKKLSKILTEHVERSLGMEEEFRFLYYNHMNLALKTSLHGKAVLTMETVKLIRGIHADFKTSKLSQLVRKYNVTLPEAPHATPPQTPHSPVVRVQLPNQDESKKSPSVTSDVTVITDGRNRSTGRGGLIAVVPPPPNKADEPPHGFLPVDLYQHAKEGIVEVCIKTKSNGWVVGRRATQSHREFFVLIDDKGGNLADIQEEVEQLSRTYFCNIFIH